MAPDILIEDLPTPLALVAADVITQRELVLRRGLLWQAVLASIAIPGVYPAQRIGPYVAVDGGVLNPLPVNVAAEMGAGTVIAVKLGAAAPQSGARPRGRAGERQAPGRAGVLLRSIEMMQRGIVHRADRRDAGHDRAEARPDGRRPAQHARTAAATSRTAPSRPEARLPRSRRRIAMAPVRPK